MKSIIIYINKREETQSPFQLLFPQKYKNRFEKKMHEKCLSIFYRLTLFLKKLHEDRW